MHIAQTEIVIFFFANQIQLRMTNVKFCTPVNKSLCEREREREKEEES